MVAKFPKLEDINLGPLQCDGRVFEDVGQREDDQANSGPEDQVFGWRPEVFEGCQELEMLDLSDCPW